MTVRRQLSLVASTLVVLVGLAFVSAGPVAAAPFTPTTLTITRVVQLEDPDPGPSQGDGDYYAEVQIGAHPTQTGPEQSGADIEPFWVFSEDVDRAVDVTSVPVTLTLLDADGVGSAPDDVVDLNPVDDVQQLVFDVELDTGAWTATNVPGRPLNQSCFQGDGDREHFGFTEGGEQGEICLDFSAISSAGDADGDGLLDGWETLGYDADGDGSIDVDLPAFGADPNHKDLFLELDTMAGNAPSRAQIQAMKAAFAAAPVDAGTDGSSLSGGADANSNPDGTVGINLWVDAGTQSDPSASEDGAGDGTCSDGIDNGGGGADGADADCLIGDNLGGGNQVPASGISDLDSSFYAVKNANFDPDRRLIFRYGLSAAPGFEDGSTAGGSCRDGVDNGGDGDTDGDDDDCWPWGGGWGEIGGNDFIEYNHDGGTIMHELGHTLNLRHGGGENDNCKPNYVSVMNYDNQFRIRQNAGGSILDYSPPRTSTGRGAVPLGPLTENSLDETLVLDATDSANQFVFTDANGDKVRNALNAPVDYNGDGDAVDNPVTVNVDDAGSDGNPAACDNGSSSDTHTGFDDWSAISIPFRQFGDAEDGAINKITEPEITLPELQELEADLNTADLSVTMADSADPVAAGEQFTYPLTVANDGPNPSDATVLTDTLPAEVSYVSDDAGCTHAGGVVTCELGALAPGTSTTLDIVVEVGASVVYDNGGPTTITNSASVANSDAGPDPDPADNHVSEDTQVVAVADLAVDSVTVDAPPALAVLGSSFDVTVTSQVSNGGPSSPVDAVVTTDGSSPGGSVVPAGQASGVTALSVGSPQPVVETFTLECATPGVQTFTFDVSIAPANAVDSDPDAADDTAQVSVDIDCVVPVAINVMPGGGNPIKTRNGTVPVGVLTTAAGEYGLPLAFDATTLDPLSVLFGTEGEVFGGLGGAQEKHARSHLEDSVELDETTLDGDTDNVLHFAAGETSLTPADTRACVFGSSTEGPDTFRFFGCDTVGT